MDDTEFQPGHRVYRYLEVFSIFSAPTRFLVQDVITFLRQSFEDFQPLYSTDVNNETMWRSKLHLHFSTTYSHFLAEIKFCLVMSKCCVLNCIAFECISNYRYNPSESIHERLLTHGVLQNPSRVMTITIKAPLYSSPSLVGSIFHLDFHADKTSFLKPSYKDTQQIKPTFPIQRHRLPCRSITSIKIYLISQTTTLLVVFSTLTTTATTTTITLPTNSSFPALQQRGNHGAPQWHE